MGCENSKHNCNEVKRKIELLIDHELSVVEEKGLMEQIRQCPSCLTELDIHQKYKDFILKRLEKKCCHQEIVNTIREQLKKIQA